MDNVKDRLQESVNDCLQESVKGCLKESVKGCLKESVKGCLKESVKECLKENIKEAIDNESDNEISGEALPAGTQADMFMAEEDRHGFYKTLFNRRDVRGQFKPDPVPDDVLSRVLYAAHHAPSVGFMQPWNFIVIRSPEVKKKVQQDFALAHAEAEQMFEADKRDTYRNLKLEGILESPVNICITCDRKRTGPTVIGRTHMGEMDLYSSVCAVQNFWLAARTEGLGVGWVSILHHKALRKTLALPSGVVPIAYLCVGYVDHFYDKPELETAKWLPRTPLDELVSFEQWGQSASADEESLIAQIQQDKAFPTSF